MFKKNKYKVWYDNIVRSTKNRIPEQDSVVERHRILPGCMGGTYTSENVVYLTPREHFVCHWLLVKCVESEIYERKLKFALAKFMQNGKGQARILNGRQYEIARKAFIEARTGYKHSAESKEMISKKLKGTTPWNKGKTLSKETRDKMSKSHKGKKKSEKHRNNISKGKIGHKAGMTGRRHTDETKAKMSKNMKGARGPQRRIDSCPCCSEKSVTFRHIKFCKIKRKNKC